MKNYSPVFMLLLLSFIACRKESLPEEKTNSTFCGVTNFTGPVRYYLTPYDKSLFDSYKQFNSLTFVDSYSNDTNSISYSSNSQAWDVTEMMSSVQGDTVDYGENAGVAYNYGTVNIKNMEYTFDAYANSVDSMRIFLCGKSSVCFWTLNLIDTNSISNSGYTPFVRLDSITLLSRTFYDVYLLQNGNSLSPGDSSNNCYYSKANGIIGFTDKEYNRFWVRTSF